MPQDGSNNYQYPPGTPGIPDQTIESEAYNTFLDDLVVNDLNIARPVHRGGTGAVNAHDARFNLSTEVSGAVVTNYDAHIFENGSFNSAPGATGVPAGEETHYLTGACSLIDTTGITIKAFSLNTRLGYLRTKIGGTWGDWEVEGDERFVNVDGDEMTGNLVGLDITATYFVPKAINGGFQCKDGTSNVVSASYFNFKYETALLHAYIDNTWLGSVNITSDYRIKKDVLDLPGMWDIVKALRPIKYTHAEYTPPAELERSKEVQTPFIPADNIERWGFIAHELQNTLLPSAASGVKDQVDAIQSLNLAPIVAALTKCIQEAMARIEALESAG